MPLLSVEEFSCIRSAEFRVAPVTVLIGPQGSGKSVTTKLTYFLNDILSSQFSYAESGDDLDRLKREIAYQFKIWFPASAWGSGRFNINFSAGPYSVRILRRMSKGAVTDDVSVTFSDFFNATYKELLAAYSEYEGDNESVDTGSLRRSLERSWRLRERFERRIAVKLSDEFISSQTFIPAGRAFFTSIGRLVAAIEHGGSLDPVTIRFAKLFANIRDAPRLFLYRTGRRERIDLNRREEIMHKLFGGDIKNEKDLEFVETPDGRKIPFSALSSGQQELLPMWVLIDLLSNRESGAAGSELFYIEEPEAHLFPAAQSLLMEFLISSFVSNRNKKKLVITTHSPYILSKLNNFLKAGSLAEQKRNVAQVSSVVPRECWLTQDKVVAYAIENGTLNPLITEDGLIDASYIDSVSDEVSEAFSKLLDIEFARGGK